MKKLFFIILLFCVILSTMFCFASVAISGEFPKQLNISRQEDYPPYIFEKDGKTVGICVELAEEALKLLGITVSYTQYPFLRMLNNGKKGKCDAVMLVFKTAERQEYLYYPENSLYYEENSFFTKRDSVIVYNGKLEDLKDYSVGVVTGFSYGDVFDNAAYIKRDMTPNNELLVKKIMGGRFDLGIGSKYVISYHAGKIGVLGEIKFLEPNLFDKNPLYIGFTKAKPDYDELAVKFSEAVDALKKTGHYQNILKKYNIEM